MPIHEFKCIKGHVTEKFFATFKEAEGVDEIVCPVCTPKIESVEKNYPKADKIVSVPGVAILYGDGFYKPAASGKIATKSVDVEKFIKDEGLSIVDANTGQKIKPTKANYERAVATAKRTAKKR